MTQTKTSTPLVSVVMGSDTDLPVMTESINALQRF